MGSWVELEEQHTPHKIISLGDGESVEIKPNIHLKAIEAKHTVPALSYAIVEHRKKLKEQFRNLSQHELRDLKKSGEDITNTLQIPLIVCTGDTEMGEHLHTPEFRNANIVITECTFFEDGHRGRASLGKHLHIDDLAELVRVWKAEHIVITHTSRRTSMDYIREKINQKIGGDDAHRIHILMEHRENRKRYENQHIESKEISDDA